VWVRPAVVVAPVSISEEGLGVGVGDDRGVEEINRGAGAE